DQAGNAEDGEDGPVGPVPVGPVHSALWLIRETVANGKNGQCEEGAHCTRANGYSAAPDSLLTDPNLSGNARPWCWFSARRRWLFSAHRRAHGSALDRRTP